MACFVRYSGIGAMALAMAIGCGEPASCPAPEIESALKVKSGTYYTVTDVEVASDNELFPSFSTTAPKAAVIDRDRGVVQVSYLREGRRVVETWGITGSSVK